MQSALEELIDSVWNRIEKNNVSGRTVTLKIKYADFRQITRSRSNEQRLIGKDLFADTARELLAELLPVPLGIRLMGLILSNLSEKGSSPAVGRRVIQQEFEFQAPQ